MLGSFRIGTVFGIHVRVHWLFLAMLVFFTLGPVHNAWLFPMLCVIVFLHELGHSLVAQAFGIRVVDITFWPLGGMARMSEIPEDTRKESLIALAGPAVNFVLAGLAAPAWILVEQVGAALVWSELLRWFVWMNLGLGLFNLVPAFPMDGGRILRALLGARGDWVRATEQAVHVGRALSLVMGFVGFVTGNFVLPLIAVWLWFVGGQELAAVRRRHAGARDPLASLAEFLRRAAQAAAAQGAGAAASGARTAPASAWSAQAFGAPPRGAPQAAPETEAAPSGTSARGFDTEEIERLERFHGPLRQYRREDESEP